LNLTAEQIKIINSTGNFKNNVVAGSGKTTTIIEYTASRPKHSPILYLAFNKSVKLEARKKIAGLHNRVTLNQFITLKDKTYGRS
jgi:hypothetical protein